MVVGFLGEAAWQSTPNRSKTFAAQRLSSTNRGSQSRANAKILIGRHWPGLAALIVMPKMVSKNPIKRKREEKRLAKLQKQGRLVKGVEIPENSLAANPDAQEHHGGYSAKFYYQDIHYTCSGCGKPEVWTAQQQKRYFEAQKGNIYNEPKWCYDCHSKRMKEKEAKKDKA